MSFSADSLSSLRLGDFEIHEELGRGGMGVVYRAHQISLNRRVALKVLSGNFSLTHQAVDRFKREAAAAARLHHPHIVPVYATGESEGLHFFAMELIDGQSLDKVISQMRANRQAESFLLRTTVPATDLEKTVVIDRPDKPTPLPPNGVSPMPAGETTIGGGQSTLFSAGRQFFDTLARMIADVAEALDYAHQQGVIHRDIKPGNLILSSGGRLHVGDFGLARLMEEPGLTMTGGILGSPHYMSPEQVDPENRTLDKRTDIYSLGVTLYEMLTLQTPYKGAGAEHIVNYILTREPKAPRKLNRHIPKDLETICLKAMEKDSSRRYQSGSEMADDLRRYANRFSIAARPISYAGRTIRWTQRHPAGAGLIIASLILLLALTGLWSAIKVQNTLQKQRDQERNARAAIRDARDGEANARQEIEGLKNFLQYSLRIRDAYAALESGDGPRAQELLDGIQNDSALASLPGFEWRHLWDRTQHWKGRSIWQESPGWRLSAVALSPDGTELAVSGSIKDVRIFYGMPRPTKFARVKGHSKWVNRVAYSPNGQLLATASDDQTVRLWDMTVYPPESSGILKGHTDKVYEAKFSPDGSRLVSCSSDGSLKLWDVANRSLSATLDAKAGRISSVAYAHDGSRIAAAGSDGAVRLWDPNNHSLLATMALHGGEVMSVAFSPDGRWLGSCDKQGLIKLTRLNSSQETTIVQGHKSAVYHLTFSPDSSTLSTCSLDKTLKLWSIPDLAEIKTFRGHRDLVFGSEFSSDGRGLVSVSMDGSTKLWDLTAMSQTNFVATPERRVWSARYAPNGKLMAELSTARHSFQSKTLRLWTLPEKAPLAELSAWTNSVIGINVSVGFSPDSHLLAAPGADGRVNFWNTTSRKLERSWKLDSPDLSGVRFSPDGARVAVWGVGPSIQLLDPETGESLDAWEAAPQKGRGVIMVEFSPDGKLIASVGRDQNQILVRDIHAKTNVFKLHAKNAKSIQSLAFSPDSTRLAEGDSLGKVRVWNAMSGEQIDELDGHVGMVNTLLYTRDGKSLISAAEDSTLAFWHAKLNQQIARFATPTPPGELSAVGVTSLDFNPELDEMAIAFGGFRIQFWRGLPPDMTPTANR